MTAPKADHWKAVATSEQPEDWELRSQLAAYLIRPADVVCDLGAGAQAIRSMIPSSVEYVPVDCVKEHDATLIMDLNSDFMLPDRPFDVILCLGLLRYIDDLPKFFERLIAQKPATFVVFTFGFRPREKSNGLLRNEISTQEQGIDFFAKYVDDLRVVACISKSANRYLFSGTLRSSEQNRRAPTLRTLRELATAAEDQSALSIIKFVKKALRSL